MSIGVCLYASEGLVIAADRQQTSGYQKTDTGKISGAWKREPFGSLLITGAGDASCLDAVARELRNWFKDDEKLTTPDDIGKALGQIHREFYSKNVMPFASYPEHERPDYALLAGCAMQGHRPQFWKSDKLVFDEGEFFDAVGIGSSTAMALLNKLYAHATIFEAVSLAVIIMYEVKAAIDGCGLGTDVSYTYSGVMQTLAKEHVREIEDAYLDYRKCERADLFYCLGNSMSRPPLSLIKPEERKEQLREVFQGIHAKLKEPLTQ